MESSSPEPAKKLIIDEDWKAQVEREKAAAKQGTPTEAEASPAGDLPPASFDFLVTSLVGQTLVALGQLPDPRSKTAQVELPLAKLHIDLLAVLQEKTKGNLTPQEDAMLEDVLYQLRMLYISVRDRPPDVVKPIS